MKTQSQEHLPSPIKSLRQLVEAEQSCARCPLYRDATQAVPGEGPNHAPFMLIGEQPGDKEDIAGKPFVGPAGRVLDQALQDAGIRRTETFVTNAVKHFKHEMRGKRRLHKRPDNYEIERCKIWLDVERSLVKPDTIVALGVTAARSLTGRTLGVRESVGDESFDRRGRSFHTPILLSGATGNWEGRISVQAEVEFPLEMKGQPSGCPKVESGTRLGNL